MHMMRLHLKCYIHVSMQLLSACEDLVKWFSFLGVVPTRLSDPGPHFKNDLMQSFNNSFHTHDHFSTPDTPRVNGTVKISCLEVLLASNPHYLVFT